MRHRLPFLLLACLGLAFSCRAAPSLVCEVSYGGSAQQIVAQPVADPYPVPSVDIAGRFRFKPVIVGEGSAVRRVLIYVYRQAGDEAVLIGGSNSHSLEKREAHEQIPPKELAGSAVGGVLSTCGPVSGPLASGSTLPDVENS